MLPVALLVSYLADRSLISLSVTMSRVLKDDVSECRLKYLSLLEIQILRG